MSVEASPDVICQGLTVLLACSPLAHQHPRDGPRTASPQCSEQLQKPVRAGKGVPWGPLQVGFQSKGVSSLVAFAQAFSLPGTPAPSL